MSNLFSFRAFAPLIWVLLVGGWCRHASAHPYYGSSGYGTLNCSQCHGNLAAMSTSPANGGTLTFPKTLLGRSSTASFTVTNTSNASLQTTAGGGGFRGSFPPASGPFSPQTSQPFQTAPPVNASGSYSFVLPPGVVATDGGQSSVSQVYTFTPTTRGPSSQTITFTPSIGFFSPPSSTVTLSAQGVAPVISLDSSSATAGNVRIGTTGTASLKIQNVGDGNQAGAGLGNLTGSVGAASGGFTGSGGSFNLADNGNQTFNFTVVPATHGAISSTIAINATDGNSNGTNSAQQLSAALSATGVGPTLYTSQPAGSTLSFGSPQASPDTMTVANVTTDANLGALTNLDIISATLSGTGASMFSLSGFNAGAILSKSQSANFQVSFAPTSSDSGSETATLTLVTDEGAANGVAGKTVSFALAGTATTATLAAYWKGAHSGAWNATSPGFNWTVASGSSTEVSALPTASTDVFFTAANPTTTNMTLGQNMSVKSLTFASTSAPMTIGGSNTLTIANGITVGSGTATQTITAPVQLAATQTWTIGGTMSVSGAISGSGSTALVKSGGGNLLLSGANTYSGETSVTAGTLQIGAAAALPAGMSISVAGSGSAIVLDNGLASAVKVAALNLDGGSSSPQARFDLGNGKLILDMTATPLNTIRSQILAASASGAWTGNGITSSVAATEALASGGKGNTAIGYANNGDPGMGLTTFGGQSVNANSALVRYTVLGDANLDGKVDLSDFLALRQNFGVAGNATWDQGDFDYDGKVDLNDFLILRSHYGQSLPTGLAGAIMASPLMPVPSPSVSAVPEATSGTLLLSAIIFAAGSAIVRKGLRRKTLRADTELDAPQNYQDAGGRPLLNG